MALLAGLLLTPLGVASLVYVFNNSRFRAKFDEKRLRKLKADEYGKTPSFADIQVRWDVGELFSKRVKSRFYHDLLPFGVNKKFAEFYLLYALAVLIIYGLFWLIKAISPYLTFKNIGIVIGIIVVCAIVLVVVVAFIRSRSSDSYQRGTAINKRYAGALCVIGVMAFLDYTGRYVYDSLSSRLSVSPITVEKAGSPNSRSFKVSLPKSDWRDTGLWVVPGSTVSLSATQDAQPFWVRIGDTEFKSYGEAHTGNFLLDVDVLGNSESRRGKPFALVTGTEKIFLKLDPQSSVKNMSLTMDLGARDDLGAVAAHQPSVELQWRNFWVYIPLWVYGAIVVLIVTFFLDWYVKTSPKKNDPLGLMKYLE